MLKIHIYQDVDHPEISLPPDDKSCETAIRLLIGIFILLNHQKVLIFKFKALVLFSICTKVFVTSRQRDPCNLVHLDSEFRKRAPRFAHFEETDAE